MGGELGERPKQGLVTQTVSKIVMSFAKQVCAAVLRVFCAVRSGDGCRGPTAAPCRPVNGGPP